MNNNLLEIYIDEFAHSDNMEYIDRNVSFSDLKVVLKFFLGWAKITPDDLWNVYNSENKKMLTNIPLVKDFIDDCKNDEEIKCLIKELIS